MKLTQDRAEELAREIKRLVREGRKTEAAAKQGALQKLRKQLDAWAKAESGPNNNVGFDWVVEFAEVFLPETGHEAAARVGDSRGDVDQLDAALEAEALLVTARARRRGRRWLLPMERHHQQRDGGPNDRQPVAYANHVLDF